jgi:hypothetical protein
VIKRYVVATEALTEEQQRAFAARLPQPQFGWWHWLPNFWLVVDTYGTTNADYIRDQLASVSGIQSFVGEVEPKFWSGMFTQDKMRRDAMAMWLTEHWNTTPPSPY